MGFMNGNPPSKATEVIRAVTRVWRDGLGFSKDNCHGPFCSAPGITGRFRGDGKSSIILPHLRKAAQWPPGWENRGQMGLCLPSYLESPGGVGFVSFEASWRSSVSLPSFTKKEVAALCWKAELELELRSPSGQAGGGTFSRNKGVFSGILYNPH